MKKLPELTFNVVKTPLSVEVSSWSIDAGRVNDSNLVVVLEMHEQSSKNWNERNCHINRH